MSSHERAHNDEANNVTYQRSQYAYEFVQPIITGKKVLDVGCGNAYGTALMAKYAAEITGLDYDQSTVDENIARYKDLKNLSFKRAEVPPIPFPDNSFDVITSFQFIEHIVPRKEFLKECLRVVKPGGKFIVTTPNTLRSFARNPFHIHEYTFDEMRQEASSVLGKFELKGMDGNDRVNAYYEENGKFVKMILKWDILKLHQILPAAWVAKPYNWITSMMRNKLKEKVSQTKDITTKDFFIREQDLDKCIDIYLIAGKA